MQISDQQLRGAQMKKCSKCKMIKELSEFGKDSHTKDKMTYDCKECRRESSKRWNRENPDKRKEITKKYVNKMESINPDYQYAKSLKSTYGITFEEYNQMFTDQNGCCAICGTHQSELKKRLYVDHCHKNNAVRKLLCQYCNTGLGMFKDNPDILYKAIEYLRGI